MPRSPRSSVEEFEELRRLLLSREREQLRSLRDRITDKERRSSDVAAILPEAVKLSRNRGGELSRALQPTVEDSIKEWIGKKPDTFIEAFGPIMGSIVRRWIAASFRRFLRSVMQVFGHNFSWQRLKWRIEARRTGRSFAEVEMLRSLVYRVEELFLIHRETGASLLRVSADPDREEDSKVIDDMLSAIQEFARDSFGVSTGSALVEFRAGPLQVWIALGRYAYLAAVIRGNPSRELRSTLEKTIETVHVLKGSALANFNGNASAFQSLLPQLKSCLRSQHYAMSRDGRPSRAWMVLAVAAALAIFATLQAVRSELTWKSFLDRLNAQPGLIVTEARKGWFSRSHVSGLRDASAANPAPIAREEKLNPAGIDFQWKDYVALDPASVMERFKQRFGTPPGTQATINDGMLTLSGSVPYEWLERVRREATLLPGIASIVDRDAEVTYDPGAVLTRLKEKLNLPETVHALFAKGVLTLSGEASHGWLSRVRSEATKIPGITSVDERNVIDLDQRAFQQSKSILENASVYFLGGKDEIAPEGFVVLARLPDQINRLANAAKQIGTDVTLDIQGSADGRSDDAKQPDLGQRRADKVRDFLVSCGFQPNGLKSIGTAEPLTQADEEKAVPGQSAGRVVFKVVPHEPTPTQ
jgi:outer membrane protein OmpA-like peptidoglycan-associated protein